MEAKSSSSSFVGFRKPNREPQESFGKHGKFRTARDPKPLRSPYSKSTKHKTSSPKAATKDIRISGENKKSYFMKKKRFVKKRGPSLYDLANR